MAVSIAMRLVSIAMGDTTTTATSAPLGIITMGMLVSAALIRVVQSAMELESLNVIIAQARII